MTALSVCQSIAVKQKFARPSAVFGETTDDAYLLQELVHEAVRYVREEHSWQALSSRATIAGDGATKVFDVPADYDFVPRANKLWSSAFAHEISQIQSQDEWLYLEVRDFSLVYNAWIIYGDQLHMNPALNSGETAEYFYQSNQAVVAADGTTFKAEVTADTDSFRIPEFLIRLCMIWMYRRDNELPYESEMDDYERAKGFAILRDRGPKSISVGAPKFPRGVRIAYPWTIQG